MYLSIWLGIAMSTTQTGCSIFNGNDAPHLASNEVRRATIVDDSFVGRLFGKSRGKPDDRVLESPEAHLTTAIQTAKQLEEDLVNARDDLKATIETAIAAPSTR